MTKEPTHTRSGPFMLVRTILNGACCRNSGSRIIRASCVNAYFPFLSIGEYSTESAVMARTHARTLYAPTTANCCHCSGQCQHTVPWSPVGLMEHALIAQPPSRFILQTIANLLFPRLIALLCANLKVSLFDGDNKSQRTNECGEYAMSNTSAV